MLGRRFDRRYGTTIGPADRLRRSYPVHIMFVFVFLAFIIVAIHVAVNAEIAVTGEIAGTVTGAGTAMASPTGTTEFSL